MKTNIRKAPANRRKTSRSESAIEGQVHPIVIYPFKQPDEYGDLESLYGLVARLNAERERYCRPITVVDRKTYYTMERNKAFMAFREGTVARHSDILDAWCVDTCQMWYEGMGTAFERGKNGDVYWLIPGDFNYGSPMGQEVLNGLHDLPEIIQELDQDLCVGEIATNHHHSKQLIDTYGTFALLYNWFPRETEEIRQFTERPRSEFFAVRHEFLREVLAQRWFPYEQTMVMLLQAVFTGKRFTRFSVGNVSDLPEGRDSLTSAMRQVERTEGVLKTVWRERNQRSKSWVQDYRTLERRSEQVRRTALTILENLLG